MSFAALREPAKPTLGDIPVATGDFFVNLWRKIAYRTRLCFNGSVLSPSFPVHFQVPSAGPALSTPNLYDFDGFATPGRAA